MSPYGMNHQVINNLIEGNGHTKPDGVPRLGWYRREGIAIDASSEHYIADNDINDNAFGGIFLYKNCWEHADEEPNSRPRTDHARANIIERNHFRDQPFGIWIAARQSRDLGAMGCGDPTPYQNPIAVQSVFHPLYANYPSANAELYLLSLNYASVWPDYAEDNQIIDNTFQNIIRGGVRVEDDGTEIVGNLFVGNFDYIFVGAPFRARLAGQPILNTVITDNSYGDTSESMFQSHLALIPDEHQGTVLEDNFRACPNESGGFIRHGAFDILESETPDPCDSRQRICENGYWVQPTLADECEPVALEDASMESDSQPDVGTDDEFDAGLSDDTQPNDSTDATTSNEGSMLDQAQQDAELESMMTRGTDVSGSDGAPSMSSNGCRSSTSMSLGLDMYGLFILLLILGRRRMGHEGLSATFSALQNTRKG